MNENQATVAAWPRVVFVATDLSESADEALRQAHKQAKAADAKLVVCLVVANPGLNVRFPQRTLEQTDMRAELHRQALQALIARTCKATGRVASEFKAIVDEGTPYASIVAHAEQASAELIVIGDRGATGLSRVLLGSVAESVLRHATCSVLVARPPATDRVD